MCLLYQFMQNYPIYKIFTYIYIHINNNFVNHKVSLTPSALG